MSLGVKVLIWEEQATNWENYSAPKAPKPAGKGPTRSPVQLSSATTEAYINHQGGTEYLALAREVRKNSKLGRTLHYILVHHSHESNEQLAGSLPQLAASGPRGMNFKPGSISGPHVTHREHLDVEPLAFNNKLDRFVSRCKDALAEAVDYLAPFSHLHCRIEMESIPVSLIAHMVWTDMVLKILADTPWNFPAPPDLLPQGMIHHPARQSLSFNGMDVEAHGMGDGSETDLVISTLLKARNSTSLKIYHHALKGFKKILRPRKYSVEEFFCFSAIRPGSTLSKEHLQEKAWPLQSYLKGHLTPIHWLRFFVQGVSYVQPPVTLWVLNRFLSALQRTALWTY